MLLLNAIRVVICWLLMGTTIMACDYLGIDGTPKGLAVMIALILGLTGADLAEHRLLTWFDEEEPA